MHIMVLGAGVVGLTTALCLAEDGHAVTILERESGPGLGTSRANGGQLSYSYVAPLASPGALKDIPLWLLDPGSPLRFRPRLDPHQWRWCLSFLAACTGARSRRGTERLLALSLYSRELMDDLLARTGLSFDHARNGKLVVYSSAASFTGARRQMAFQAKLGCEQEAVDAERCLALEPALGHIRHRIVGGIFTPSEQVGDCHAFCEAIAARLRAHHPGVRFAYGQSAEALICDDDRVVAVQTGAGALEADAFVLALGTGSRRLAREAGVSLPIYPLKGYSLTVPVHAATAAPRVSVTDAARKVVYAPLGGRLRVAGMADIVGDGLAIESDRFAQLVREARAVFPDASDYRHLEPWCGARPATPTGLPLLGPAGRRNLMLNVGHGALGFTLAMGAARVVADLLAGRAPRLSMDGFGWPRPA